MKMCSWEKRDSNQCCGIFLTICKMKIAILPSTGDDILRCLCSAVVNTVKQTLKLSTHRNSQILVKACVWTLPSVCIPPESISVVGTKMQGSKQWCRCQRMTLTSLCSINFINTFFVGGLSKTSSVNRDTDAGCQAIFKVLVHPEVLYCIQQRQTEVEDLQRRQLSSTKGLYMLRGLPQPR